MRFEVTTLGTGAALPARGRHPSAQVVNVREELYLVDCGEGTQERLRAGGFNFMRIGHVFISHLHGDHFFGFMGLLSTMHLNGRTKALQVHAPAALRDIVRLQLEASGTYLRFPLHFHALDHASGAPIMSDKHVEVFALRLRHRIPTTGFLFREKPWPRPLRKETLHLVPHFQRNALKAGEDLVMPDGTVHPNALLTLDPPAPRSYAYCSDTAPAPELLPHLSGVDLLYHEATFTEALSARARDTMHSTAAQAAAMARDAGAGSLLLGHFSSRYKDERPLLSEALEVFPHVAAAQEGRTYPVDRQRIVDNLG